MNDQHAMARILAAHSVKYGVVLAALCFCSIMAAQQSAASLPNSPQPALRFPLSGLFSAGVPQTAQSSQSTKPKSTRRNKKLAPMKRREIEPSPVGYIDDPTVGSEVRVRFDAGSNAPQPDLAEFFYQGHSTPLGPTVAFQRTLNFQQLYLNAEYSPRKSVSGFLQIPYRWIQPIIIPSATRTPDLSSGSGISDVQAGLKFGAIASETRNLTFQLRADFPSGDGSKGFGTGHYSLEPAALFYQKLTGRAAVEAELGDSHPIGGTMYRASATSAPQNFASDVMMYGVGPSYQALERENYSIAPVLELVGWHVFGGLQTNAVNQVESGAGANIFNVKLGARVNWIGGNSVYAGYGRGVTSNIWYRNLFRIEYRHYFGSSGR
jgi:hypothetical protein